MAWTILPKPGTEHIIDEKSIIFPCVGDCHHNDCRQVKKEAASLCSLCEEPIGFDKKITGNPYQHFICVVKEVDRKQEEMRRVN